MAKTILITGSTDGIGKLAAIKLASEGHEIYLHGRSSDKLKKVIAEVMAQSNNKNIKGFVADFSDLKAVKKMAQDVNSELSKIDVLINNAGVFKSTTLFNKDRLDIRFVVNYLAPYLLTEELTPLLQKGNKARIINLSSAAQTPVSYEALKGNSQIPMQVSYAQSKLALTMWSFHIAKSLKKIDVIALNPGSLLNTNMVKEAFGHHRSPADKGAVILFELANAEKYTDVNGKYYDNDKEAFGEAHPDAYNEAKIDKLIKSTKVLLNLE